MDVEHELFMDHFYNDKELILDRDMDIDIEQKLIAKQLVAKMLEIRTWDKKTRDLLIWAEREWGGRTLKDIGMQYCVSNERVRQIHKKVGMFVKRFMEKTEKV